MKLTWRIVESKRGFHAQGGVEFKADESTNPGFVVYQSARFNTRRQAEKYIERQNGK